MSKKEYSPGPWLIVGKDKPMNGMSVKYIATEHGQRLPIIQTTGLREPEDTANANLVSAAPDMLEALRALLPITGGIMDYIVEPLRDKIEAAVKKAEGRR